MVGAGPSDPFQHPRGRSYNSCPVGGGWSRTIRGTALGVARARTQLGNGQGAGEVPALMPISGTLLNVLTVLIGGTLGLLVGGRLPERFQSIVLGGLGLSTLIIGVQGALLTKNILILLGAILIGGLIGEAIRLSDGLDNLG